MRYLVLDDNGFVVNIIIWDGVSKLPKRNKNVMLQSDALIGITFGWQLVDGEWIAAPVIEQPEE